MNRDPDEEAHFGHAPIVEALLDVRVSLPEGTSIQDVAPFDETVRIAYPTREVRNKVTGHLEFKPESLAATSASIQPMGYLWRSQDNTQVVQATIEGFSFSRLKPYQDWEHLSQEAFRLWQAYADLVKPHRVDRVALRYINRLELPIPIGTLEEYLRIGPRIAPELPQEVWEYFFRVVLRDEASGASAIVTEVVEEAAESLEYASVILDIDVFRVGSFGVNRGEIESIFEKLRSFKNRVFLSAITEKTKELIR